MTSPDWDIFDRIQDFPFAVSALSEIKRYLRSVHEFLPHISDQEIVRLRAKLETTSDPVEFGELEGEIEHISKDGSLLLSRLVWGGALVSIWAAYEFGVEQILHHWHAQTRHKTRFRVMPGEDFLTSAERYSSEQVRIPLLPRGQYRKILSHLKNLRNSYVHKGSRVSTLSPGLRKAIEQKDHVGVSLTVTGECWVANAQSAAFFLTYAERAARAFGNAALDKCLEQPRK